MFVFSAKNIEGPANGTLADIHAYARGRIKATFLHLLLIPVHFRKYCSHKQHTPSTNAWR